MKPKADLEIKRVMVYGIVVDVSICKPSRRRAASNIQRRWRRSNNKSVARWIAKDRGLIY